MPKVDLANYIGREQAFIKHCLLEEYLPDWAYKVGSAWDSLVYVDGFAGPWQTTHADYADTSFGVLFRDYSNVKPDYEKPTNVIFRFNAF